MDKIRIEYPTYTRSLKIRNWYRYLDRGFRNIGELQYSDKLNKEYLDRGGRGILPIDIFVNESKCRVWYDWSAWQRRRLCDFEPQYNAIMGPKDTYVKIQMLEDHKPFPRVYPIHNVTARMEYFDLLARLRKLAKKEAKYDIVGVFSATAYKLRYDAVKRMQAADWKDYSGIYRGSNRPADKYPVEKQYEHHKMNHDEHLLLQAQSKINLSLPGVGPKCFRDTEVMGMGRLLMLSKSVHGDMIFNDTMGKTCWVTLKPDISDLEEKVNYYLEHDKKREEIAANGLWYFNTHCTPEAMAKYIVNCAKENM